VLVDCIFVLLNLEPLKREGVNYWRRFHFNVTIDNVLGLSSILILRYVYLENLKGLLVFQFFSLYFLTVT
jgi:hypothetical protein